MPPFATLAGLTMLQATISLTRCGTWVARLMLDAEQPPTGPVTLTANEGAVLYQGTTIGARTRAAEGRSEAVVVGGAGGLARELPPRAYRSVPARLVIEDLLREAGEQLHPDSSAALLGQQLPHWSRLAGRTSHALDQLSLELGAGWRIGLDGRVLLRRADEPRPLSTTRGELLREHPGEGLRVYALERLDLEPDTILDGRLVVAVQHEISFERIRSLVWS